MSFINKIVCKDREDRNIRFNSMKLTHADVSRGTEQVDDRMEWVVYHGPSLEGGIESEMADLGVEAGMLETAQTDAAGQVVFEAAVDNTDVERDLLNS